jgi:hypothetical protein
LARDTSTARVKNRIMVRGIVNSRNRFMTNWKTITVGRISAKSHSNPMFSIRLELRFVLGYVCVRASVRFRIMVMAKAKVKFRVMFRIRL